MGQPQRKPVEQMYFAYDAVHLAVVDRRIRDVAVTQHQRLVDRSRASIVLNKSWIINIARERVNLQHISKVIP